MKLRWNNAVMTAAVLVPVIGSAGIAVHMLADAERNAALGGLHKTAAATVLSIDREISEADAALRTLASVPSLFTGDMKALYAAATAANGSNTPAWIVIADERGRQLLNTRVPLGTAQPPFVHRPQHGSTSNAPSISGLIDDPSTGALATLIERTITLKSGKRFIVAKVFPAAYFDRAFQREGQEAEWVAAIFDGNYRTIARTHKPGQFVGTPAKDDTAKALANPTTTILRHTIRGNLEVYDVFARSKISGWSVALGAPVGIVESAVKKAVTITAIGLLIAALSGVVAATLYGRRLVRAVKDLGETALQLGQGQRLSSSKPSRIDEVNQVRAALYEAAALIEQEREQRTRAEEQKEHLVLAAEEARIYAERQNQSKDEFIALLGHELRNPLSAISGAIAVMELMEPTGDRAERARAIIKRQTDHLARMITDLLDLSRVLAGKVYLEKKPIDLRTAVLHCIEALVTGQQDIAAITPECDSGITVFADPTRLDQMLINLLGNAAKFTPISGTIIVRVKTNNDAAIVEIRDSGIGISPAMITRVFDAFVQDEQALDRSRGGLGIGLSLVKRLAELHGGAVSAASEGNNRGATFTLRLPVFTSANAESLPLEPVTPSGALTVLLLDDHRDSREMNAMLLRSVGHTVMECADATEVFQNADLDFDVAVIDIGLPGMDGYEVARRLRTRPGTQSACLIALTGYGTAADQRRALEAGFDVHLVKPVSQKTLLQTLSENIVKANEKTVSRV